MKKPKKTYIYGKHAVAEALVARADVVVKVFLAPSVDDTELLALVRKSEVATGVFSAVVEEDLDNGASHQGIIAEIDAELLLYPFHEFIEALDIEKNPALVVMDEIHDPQNVGAVIRSAAAFGVSGILLPEHNQAQITGAVVKVSAGMVFRMPMVRIGNVNQTVRTLKEKGFWVYGLDMEGKPVHTEEFSKPSAFILGNEAKGIRAKTLELCDVPLSIAMNPRTESLNAATAAAIVMHQWSVQHPDALQ